MLHLKALKGLSLLDLEENILDPGNFLELYNNYKGTNNKSSRLFLDKVLNDDEKAYLINCLHSKYGWYRSIYGEFTNKLKLTAELLGFTNSIFHYDKDMSKQIVGLGKTIYDPEQKLLTSIYLKQKLVTYKTLIQWKNDASIDSLKLYRGMKHINLQEPYPFTNLEAWTISPRIAKRFATQDGYILFKEVPIVDVFVFCRSVFKSVSEPNKKARMDINIENEYIIEHGERIMPLIFGNTIFKYMDIQGGENYGD